jgi:hypothetical protein
MNKKKTNKIWFGLFFIMFFIIGYFLYSMQWLILGIIFFITCGISLFIGYFGINEDSNSKKMLMCPKCKLGNSLYNLNNNPDSTIFIYKELSPKIKVYDGLDVFLLICFKCKKITEWASDTNNSSKTAKFGFRYFKSKIITKKNIDEAVVDAENSCSVDSLKKLKKISEEI